MKRIFFTLAMGATLLTGPANVFAAPFNPKDVAADPAILVHVDCDALGVSSIGKSILSDPDAQKGLSTVAALFDFDLRTQLHGLTVYATAEHPKDGVLIVYADFDPNRLIALAKAANSSECHTNGAHVIYTWLSDKKKDDDDGDGKRVYGSILGHRVVFGQNESHLAEALEVMDGKAPSYAVKDGLPQAEAGESVLAQGVVVKFPFDSADQNAAIFKMSKSVRLKLSETENHIDANLQLEASDTNTATQIAAIAQGLAAILKLQTGNPDALKLANAIGIKQNGSAVAVTLTMPSAELVGTLNDMKHHSAKDKDKAAKTEQN
jgi:hypothetical protein